MKLILNQEVKIICATVPTSFSVGTYTKSKSQKHCLSKKANVNSNKYFKTLSELKLIHIFIYIYVLFIRTNKNLINKSNLLFFNVFIRF